MRLPPFLNHELFGNQLIQYVWVALVILIGGALRRLFSRLLSKVLFRLIKRHTVGVTENELNELLIRDARVGRDRSSVVLSVKFGALRDPDGAFLGYDGRPHAVMNLLTYSLRRLGTDFIDI